MANQQFTSTIIQNKNTVISLLKKLQAVSSSILCFAEFSLKVGDYSKKTSQRSASQISRRYFHSTVFLKYNSRQNRLFQLMFPILEIQRTSVCPPSLLSSFVKFSFEEVNLSQGIYQRYESSASRFTKYQIQEDNPHSNLISSIAFPNQLHGVRSFISPSIMQHPVSFRIIVLLNVLFTPNLILLWPSFVDTDEIFQISSSLNYSFV